MYKLGSFFEKDGINFSIYGKKDFDIKLNLFKGPDDSEPYFSIKLDKNLNFIKNENIWSIFIDNLKDNTLYSWDINLEKNILDPYALSYINYDDKNLRKNIAVKIERKKFTRPNHNIEDLIIYELHIKSFTKDRNKGGYYRDLISKIPYLKELGINAVELMPVFEWDDSCDFLKNNPNNLKNIWGYNPISFFALTKKFSSNYYNNLVSEIYEFRDLVEAFHKNDIEVFLDVVYNHTAELGFDGKSFNFKILDVMNFYHFDGKVFKNFSGCGNSFNCNTELAKKIILDSINFYYDFYGIDGFRFDLASILGRDSKGNFNSNLILKEIANIAKQKNIKIISESWDTQGYFLGKFPPEWYEWNDKYRNCVRKFVRGDFGQVDSFIKYFLGSKDIFNEKSRSINFVCCHDGFTLWDLVSYNNKNNFANCENNLDGTNDNFSHNNGFEGESNNLEIVKNRKKKIKNFLSILLLSQGIPMIHMGDEFGRTKLGNNNSYLQDNEINWIDWERAKKFEDIQNFTKNLISIRKKFDIFRQIANKNEKIKIHGVNLNQVDTSYFSKSLAFEISDKKNITFYLIINFSDFDLTFNLPFFNNNCYLIFDTSIDDKYNFSKNLLKVYNNIYLTKKYSVVLLCDREKIYDI